MSAAATASAGLSEAIDGSMEAAPVGIPRQRRALRPVPTSGQPGDGVPDDALRLGRGMRLRLRAAVLALLADPSIAGLKDAPKLAAVVLYAKSRAPEGRKKDNQASITGRELGRWLGVSESMVHHKVLPPLRESDGLHTRVVTNEEGHPVGLDCLVMPLWKARKGGGAAHPLALSKAELATLLRLCEALFGPGWTLKDGRVIPAGLLARWYGGRPRTTGKGAATDRLALLLMVLNSRASGWLQLCGGSVKAREGRGAATLARLLGCSPAGARKVLARLTEAGVVARQRKATATRMNGRGRVMLLPVARAYGRVLAPVEVVQSSEAVFPQRPDGAVGDHAPGEGSDALDTSGVSGVEAAEGAADRERPDGAELHAVHASVVTPVVFPQLSCGFSGEGRGGEGHRPECTCVREDQAAGGESVVAESALLVVQVGPLRGEKPTCSPVEGRDGQRAAVAGAGGVRGGKSRQQRRVGLPAGLRLRVALGPVAGLWERLSGWQQDQVEAAAKAEMTRLAGMLMRPDTAPQLLADRLSDRLTETGGEALVDRPYGWLIRRGLVQRPACSDRRCDDGVRLDTGGQCDTCGNVIHLRRARRARIAAEVDRELTGRSDSERRQVLEDRLREQAAMEAEDFVRRREQARRDAAHAAAQARAERERQAAAVAVQQALPCEDCGQEQAAGLCEACGYRRQTETLIVDAGLTTATWAADLDDAADVAAVAAAVRAALEGEIASARAEYLRTAEPAGLNADPVATVAVLAFGALETVKQLAPEYRRCALAMLGRTEEAEAEARRAYKAEQNRRWFRANPTGADAVAAATKAADAARSRTAEHLLAVRLDQLREQTKVRTETAVVTPWAERLTELGTRPLDGEVAAAVIV